jgi:hypothetical protein
MCRPTYSRHIDVNIYISKCLLKQVFNVFIFSGCQQASTSGTTPTLAQAFVITHTRKDGSYPTERTKELCVCYSPYLIFISYVCDNLYIGYKHLSSALTFGTTYRREWHSS